MGCTAPSLCEVVPSLDSGCPNGRCFRSPSTTLGVRSVCHRLCVVDAWRRMLASVLSVEKGKETESLLGSEGGQIEHLSET